MKTSDEKVLQQRLRDELTEVTISPAPLASVLARGRAIRARRRALAAGIVLTAALAVVLAQVTTAPKGGGPQHTVTLNAPDPAAPGGMFASGTADGKPWRLAVRNIAADPGTRWCLPAVMLNGRDGDVLFKTGSGAPSFGSPAFLNDIPGLPGIGAAFTQVAPWVTRLVATFPGGQQLTVRPVWVSACGQRFYLAGFAFPDPRRGVTEITANARYGMDEGLVTVGLLAGTGPGPGVWVNLDKSRADMAVSRAANQIGVGTVAGNVWHISTTLGLSGQCYTAATRGGGGLGQSYECVPVAAPPHTVTLVWVSIPTRTSQLNGYAGLVSPSTAEVTVALSDGIIPPVKPVNVAGRAYIAFVVPPGCQVIRLSLFDSAGHLLASTAALPPVK